MELKKLVKSWQLVGGNIYAVLTGGITARASVSGVVTTQAYSASMTVDASLGNAVLIVPTNSTAFTLAVPTNPPGSGFSQDMTITIRNTTGGALGAATFTAGAGGYRLGAAWTQPATGFSRSITFRWDGAAWIEVSRTAADVAN